MAISHEEAVKKLTELREEVEVLVSSYNEDFQSGKIKEAMETSEKIDEKIAEYTSIARDDCFAMCKGSPDPMRAAVTALSFITIATKDEKRDDDKIPVRVIVDRERPIDLYKLHKFCGGKGIGADPQWLYMAEKLNMLLTVQKAQDLGVKDVTTINDSYAVSAIAREIDMGKNPCSKTNLLKTLQMVITAMLGEGAKATSHDVNFLMEAYSKKSRKALTVTAANHKTMRGLLAEVCHRIVTGKTYAIEYKAAKKK